jgi:DNA repair protein RecO (recombination protein O)
MATYLTKGIILKKTDHKEYDQLFVIYTEDKGKIVALGRGTKRVKSKLNCFLQPMAVINLMIAHGKNYDHIAGVTIDQNFLKIKSDLQKIILASHGLELVEKLTELGYGDHRIFLLLAKYLQVINIHHLSTAEWQIIKRAFVVKLLSLLGLEPTPDIAADEKKLNLFLENHLNSELGTEKFLARMSG